MAPQPCMLHRLHAVFGDAFEDRATYAAAPSTDAYLAALLGQSHVVALVAPAGD